MDLVITPINMTLIMGIIKPNFDTKSDQMFGDFLENFIFDFLYLFLFFLIIFQPWVQFYPNWR